MNSSNPLDETPDLARGRPHANDDIRWTELFFMAGCVQYEDSALGEEVVPVKVEVKVELMTIEEFMDRVENDMRKHGIQITPWRLG